MAYINGKWLDREERQARIELVTERLSKLIELSKTGEDMSRFMSTLEADKAELEKLYRVHNCETDMLLFFYEYFSEARNEGNPDNLVPNKNVDMEQAPEFHAKLSNILDTVSNVNKTAKIAWSASRGHAKSAYLSNAYPVREIVYRKRRMILLISETTGGAEKFIKWISGQLKYNEKLRSDFGEVLSPHRTRNDKDTAGSFLTTTGTKVDIGALKTQVRGYRNGSQRPDLIILDDLESIASNNTAELRNAHKTWFNSDLLPAGDPDKTAIIFMGTMIHADSLLAYVMRERMDFIKNQFPAIIEPPARQDLWAEFIRIFREHVPTDDEIAEMERGDTVPPNQKRAMQFYEENKEEMLRGSKVLWESRFPLTYLMLEKENIGSKAFNSEYQNNPIDEESQIFNPNNFHYYDDDGAMSFPHNKFDIGIGIDFAMGKAKGDFSAMVTVARDKKTKKEYVMDAFIERLHPDDFLQVIVKHVMKVQPDIIGVEAIIAQEFFADHLKQHLRNHNYPADTRVKKLYHTQRKELRIEAMQPEIENGSLKFSKAHTRLLEQFERYGTKDHDDGIDALEMARRVLKRQRAKVVTKNF